MYNAINMVFLNMGKVFYYEALIDCPLFECGVCKLFHSSFRPALERIHVGQFILFIGRAVTRVAR